MSEYTGRTWKELGPTERFHWMQLGFDADGLPPTAVELTDDGEYRVSSEARRRRTAKRDAEFYRERTAALERMVAETDAISYPR